MENAIVWLLVTLVGSFGGAWFGAYFKKKGENLATREDVGELTRITKEIEAKISDEAWDRQRAWELKRDVLLEGMRKLAVMPGLLSNLHAVYQKSALGIDQALIDETRLKESQKYSEALCEFDAAMF